MVGLKYLHDYGVVHRDMHTRNVLLFKENNKMVAQWTDFGLGVVIDKNEFKFKPQVSEEEGMSFEAFKA